MTYFVTEKGKYLASAEDGVIPPVGTVLAFETRSYQKDQYWDYQPTGKRTYRVWEIIGYQAIFPARGPNSARNPDSPEIVKSTSVGNPDIVAICAPKEETSADRAKRRAFLRSME